MNRPQGSSASTPAVPIAPVARAETAADAHATPRTAGYPTVLAQEAQVVFGGGFVGHAFFYLLQLAPVPMRWILEPTESDLAAPRTPGRTWLIVHRSGIPFFPENVAHCDESPRNCPLAILSPAILHDKFAVRNRRL